jgi:diacylglycerol kinase (ATP)
MRTCIVVNPNAGSVEDLEALEALLDRLPDSEVLRTEAAGDAERLAREAVRGGADLVVAAGGDGTLNEVVNGLADDFAKVRLGLIPLGTGNDFARSIGIPDDLEGALAILEKGEARAVDVGRATLGEICRFFVNMSAGGISGEVSERADEAKDRWGPLAYMRAAIDALPELKGFRTTVVVNGVETLEMEASNVIVSNGRYVASGIPAAPQAVLDDGLFDVLITPAITIPQLAALLPQVLLGRHMDNDLLLFRRATRLEIESHPPMGFNVDGELIGEGAARFEILPRALRVITGTDVEDGVFSGSSAHAGASSP